MIYKIFLILLTLNLFSSMVKASSRYLTASYTTNQYVLDSNSILNTGMNSRSSSRVSSLAKVDCVKRAISLLTNKWISKTMHLSQSAISPSRRSTVMHNFKDLFANPGYSIDWRQKFSVLKVTYSF